MTTSSWSTVIDHTSDAGFRAWGSELNTKMSGAGLVQTADTGQIDWVTVTRPANNVDAGYEVWRFADSSFYIKIFYGTASSSGALARIRVQVGTGSDGSGTLTGQTSTLTTVTRTTTGVPSSVIAYSSYLCVTSTFFGLLWKAGAPSVAGTGLGFFAVDKFCDSTGAATTDGAVIYYGATSSALASFLSYEPIKTSSPSMSYGVNTAFCLVPSLITTTAVGGDNQILLHMTPTTPLIRPVKNVFSILNSELALSTTITATTVGATSHTYISLNSQAGRGNSASVSHDVGLAMLWE